MDLMNSANVDISGLLLIANYHFVSRNQLCIDFHTENKQQIPICNKNKKTILYKII